MENQPDPTKAPPRLTIGFLRRGYSASGGVEVYLKGLASGLRQEGHRVVLLGTPEWPAEEWPGGEILRCRSEQLSRYAADAARHRRDSGIRFNLTISVEKVPDCDIYRTDEGLHAAWLDQRRPHLNPWARVFQKISPKHREKLRLERQIFRSERTRRVIAVSGKIAREIGEYYDYPARQVTLVRNGVPPVTLPSVEERRFARGLLHIGDSERIVLFVGTGWERKGLRFAIRAVEELRDPTVRLLVAGKGRVGNYASPVVRFLGPVREMAPVYAAADLLVVPSIFEPFSLAALEALGSGVPVVTSRVVGASEIMTSGVHGSVLSDPSNINGLTEAIRNWLSRMADPARAAVVRAACSSLASEYSLERNLGETLAVIHDVLAEKAANPGQAPSGALS